MQRTTPVVAVFGGGSDVATETQTAAESIGCELARRGWVLLTGTDGTGGDSEAVKDKAFAGAGRAVAHGALGARLGVERTDDPKPPSERGSSMILRPGFGHRRNYIEAHLCDAAIALPGTDGTISEVAFCLALGRPVVLVGGTWEKRYPLSERHRTRTLDKFRRCTRKQMRRGAEASPTIDALIDDALVRLGTDLPEYTYEDLPRDDQVGGILDLVRRMIGSTPGRGEFPDLPEHQEMEMAAAYRNWVARMTKEPEDATTDGEVCDER